jgi:hypothetical protein
VIVLPVVPTCGGCHWHLQQILTKNAPAPLPTHVNSWGEFLQKRTRFEGGASDFQAGRRGAGFPRRQRILRIELLLSYDFWRIMIAVRVSNWLGDGMTKELDLDVLKSWIESKAIDSTADYLARGRPYQNVDRDDAAAFGERWLASLESWGDALERRDQRGAEEAMQPTLDLAAEAGLRKIALPTDRAAKLNERLERVMAENVMAALDDHPEIVAELAGEFAEYVKGRRRGN